MCPKDDPNYLAMWLSLIVGAIVFAVAMTYLISWIKKTKTNKIRQASIEKSMIPIHSSFVTTENGKM